VERLPVMVYGTLRQGQGNHRLVAASLQGIRAARLPGHILYTDGLPYAVPCGDLGSAVAGDMLLIRPDAYPEVMASLDRLEGYHPPHHSLYIRTRCVAEYQDQPGGSWHPCTAWVYLAGENFSRDARLAVPGGDWIASRDAAA
jgi:gamma-glutamylcyclotransferase (GGCT)/AIG2-like uncharacterized protein YtfP